MSDLSLIDIVNLIRAEIARTEIGDVKRITGPAGERGPQGEAGIQGPQGPRGNDGKQGPAGAQGSQGKKGDKGLKGDAGSDGVGIARVEQDIDNAIVVYLTDGNQYTIEMPLINDDGSLAKEVHFKTGSGGSGQVDLSMYVRRPGTDLRDGRWLAYRETENGAAKEWAPITTDMVETNGQLMFRDSLGRFQPTPEELDELNNQLKVNRFIWDKIQELDLKAGGVAISEDPPDDPDNGMFWFDNSEDVMQLYIWHTDSDAWVPVAPPTTLEGRVAAGETTQAAIIAQIQQSLEDQAGLADRIAAGEAEQSTLKNKVNALEGVVGQHRFDYTITNKNPRAGEMNGQDDAMTIVRPCDQIKFIALSDTDRDGKPVALDKIQQNDVLRFYGLEGQYAEYRITDGSAGFYSVELISATLDQFNNLPYDTVLFSSFDPAGLATVSYVDAQDEANRRYVDNQIAGINFPEAVAFERPMLWKYNPNVSANSLGNGEFNLSSSPTNGGASEWSIYFAKRDANGNYWYPHDNGTSYSHAIGEQLATIRGREQVSVHGKTKQWLFNQGSNKYAQLKLTYYRSSNPLGTGKYHLITIPGYMPFFTFSTDAQTNGTHS